MGNQLVIPSQSNWYEEPLRRNKITVKRCIDSGTFFLTLDCLNFDGEELIVKAYEYVKPLDQVHVALNSKTYFSVLKEKHSATQGIINYENVIIFDRYAFLVRPKMQYTLPERLEEYPRLEIIEKMWVIYQIVSIISSLHGIELVHGALNPDNVFCDWDTRVSIGDMAPFKPTHIRFDKPNIFYHYFSTSTRTGCYLAPEQISHDVLNDNALIFNNPTYATDFFSIGCIIYYIFTGEHLFSFSSLIEYSRNKINIDKELERLPECIREFARTMLSIDPDMRTPDKLMHKTFPSCFNQIFNQFLEFFTNDGSLTHFVSMIPVFNAMVEEQDVEVRVILTNLFSRFLLTSDDPGSIVDFSFFLVDFAAPLSEEIILCRILPNIVGLLSFNSDTVKSTGLRCLVKLLESCRSVNKDLQSIIEDYIINELLNISSFSTLQSKCAFAETCPKFIMQILRLIPDSVPKIIPVSHFFINEDEKSVVSAFIYGLKQCTGGGFQLFYALFPILLSSFNHIDNEYTTTLLETIKSFYEESSEKERKQMKPLLANLSSATLGFIQHELHEELSISYLEFLEWVSKIGVLHDTLSAETFITLSNIMDTGGKVSCFLASRIINSLSPYYRQSILPNFTLKSINRQSYIVNIEDSNNTLLSYDGLKSLSDEIKINYLLPEPKEIITVAPKMLYSVRPTNRTIKSLAGSDDYYLVSTGYELFALTKKDGEPVLNNLEKHKRSIIKSMSTFGSTDYSLISYNNMTCIFNAKETKRSQISKTPYDLVKAINTKYYVGTYGNTFHLCDIRMKSRDPVYSTTFDGIFQSITDVCAWNDSNVLFGVGFEEGFVYAIDMRVFKPVSFTFSPSVKSLNPIYGNGESNCMCFVSSNNVSCRLNLEEQRIEMTSNVGGFSSILDGRSIVASDDGVYLINPKNYTRSYLISDALAQNSLFNPDHLHNQMVPMICQKSKDIKNCYDLRKNEVNSLNVKLHGHSSHITAFAHSKHFITGDVDGFVNIWSI